MTSILEIEALLGKAVMYTYSYYGRKYRGIVTGDIDGENQAKFMSLNGGKSTLVRSQNFNYY